MDFCADQRRRSQCRLPGHLRARRRPGRRYRFGPRNQGCRARCDVFTRIRLCSSGRPKRVAAARPPKPDLLEQVQSALRSNRKFNRVNAYTNGGVVTLYGKVFDDDDKRLAVRTARSVSGVTDVIDQTTTDTSVWTARQQQISQALASAGLTGVTVKVIGRDAYLDGEVANKLDRERAVTIAEGAAPVKVRTNLIRVAEGRVFGF